MNFSGIDEYSDLSFSIPGREDMPVFLGKPYVSMISHPGMILFTPKPSISEQVDDMLTSLFRLWPIFVINTIFIIMAGIVFAALVRLFFSFCSSYLILFILSYFVHLILFCSISF